jgi:serine/threonine protein kinase
MFTARDFIRCLLEVDPTKRMSLTHALRHPWLDSSGAGGSGTSHSFTTMGRHYSLSDISELSEFPEDDHDIGANGDASMLSVAPSSDCIPSVGLLNINTPAKAHARRPLERRSKVLAREAEAEAQAVSKEAEAEPATSGSTPPSVNRNSGNSGKRRRPENSAGGSPADVAMGGESADSNDVAMDVEPQPPAAKQQNAAAASTERNSSGSSSGRLLRPRAAGLVSGSCRSIEHECS